MNRDDARKRLLSINYHPVLFARHFLDLKKHSLPTRRLIFEVNTHTQRERQCDASNRADRAAYSQYVLLSFIASIGSGGAKTSPHIQKQRGKNAASDDDDDSKV